jgi:hypothetical protein
MYLKERIGIIFEWLTSPNMADFVVVQTIRWRVKEKTGLSDKETVIAWMEKNMPNTWKNMTTGTGLKLKDEYFL